MDGGYRPETEEHHEDHLQVHLERVSTRPLGGATAKDAKIVHVGNQGEPELVMFWAEVDPDALTEVRKFIIVGTGHTVPKGYKHVGSALAAPFVWHLYELGK